jgi:hypothetical protein
MVSLPNEVSDSETQKKPWIYGKRTENQQQAAITAHELEEVGRWRQRNLSVDMDC